MIAYEKMLFTIAPENHQVESIRKILLDHPEVMFVSLVGTDIGGQNTDEKIPVERFLEDMPKFLEDGVQTDGSSVVLPIIADLNNAKVDIIPDIDVNWYVDYNFNFINEKYELPVGTLRIPCFLRHNDTEFVGSRSVLKNAIKKVKKDLVKILDENPYIFDYLPLDSVDEIEDIVLTSATELEFWVKTPEAEGDKEELSTAQVLKEQYWKRTIGPVRTALEKSLLLLEKYGFEMEMGHKEVGGVKAKLGHSGRYDYIMEQLEIDWKYSSAIQAADNEKQVKYIVRDVFRHFGLDVSFRAKPMDLVAGSGEHTHIGMALKLKNGKKVNLFSPENMDKDFLNPIGYGALMGILKNYEILNPFITATTDAFNRLKPGYEAPVCIVTSLGHSADNPSRNRTVLVGLVRDRNNPLSTRFELRSPNPKSNTYLVIATAYMVAIDGIKACLKASKSSDELLKSLSKEYGQEDFYLEKNRQYRSEEDVFKFFTEADREKLFGIAPRTVWENLKAFEKYEAKKKILLEDDVLSEKIMASYRKATLDMWATGLKNRLIPQNREKIKSYKNLHQDIDYTTSEAGYKDYDDECWLKIMALRQSLGKDGASHKCLMTRIIDCLESEYYEEASELQLEMTKKMAELEDAYKNYKNNIISC